MKERDEVLQLDGACFFMHQIENKNLDPDQIIVFCPENWCEAPIVHETQIIDIKINFEATPTHNIQFKRVTLDLDNQDNLDNQLDIGNLKVIKVMEKSSLDDLS